MRYQSGQGSLPQPAGGYGGRALHPLAEHPLGRVDIRSVVCAYKNQPRLSVSIAWAHIHQRCETLPNVIQRGGRALLGAPVKRFAGRRFVPPRHLCLAKTKWRRSQEQPHEALSAAVRANTRSRVRRLFSETGTLSPPSRRIVAIHTLQKARLCRLFRLHFPLGSLLLYAHRVFLRLCGGHLLENGRRSQ